MSAPTMPSRTQADRRAIAKRARRHGYQAGLSDYDGKVACPLCNDWVPTSRIVVGGRFETMTAALDRAMLAHLNDDCPAVDR